MQGGGHMICQVIIALFANAPLYARHQKNFSHLWNKHAPALLTVDAHPHATHLSATQAAYEAYLEILSYRCQQNAPLANCSLDRRCLRHFRENLKDASRLPFVSFARGGFHSRKTAAISKYPGYKPTMESGVAYLGKSRTSLKRCSGYRGMRSST